MAPSVRNQVARELRKELPEHLFEPVLIRLWWLPVHLSLVAFWFGLGLRYADSPFRYLLSIPIGISFAGLAFLGHEMLHGAVVRQPRLRRVLGGVCFLPFQLSARLWMTWHNRIHHETTNRPGLDPDAYPSLEQYHSSALARFTLNAGAPGLARLRGLITPLIGLSVQSLHMLLSARGKGWMSRRQYLLTWLETIAAWAFWIALAYAAGGSHFLWFWILPLLIGNTIVMVHIGTNHSLSPQGEDLDVLENSLTVTVPKWFSFYTLGFGYHVEHHLFPSMSHRHGPIVSQVLERRYPERYRKLPLLSAWVLLQKTPRVYERGHTLLDPETGLRVPTLPGLLSAAHSRGPRRFLGFLS